MTLTSTSFTFVRCLGAVALATQMLCLSSAHAAGPDVQLLDAGKAAQAALVDTLKDMVLIESGSANTAGLAKMADYTERRLQALGAKTERIALSNGQPGVVLKGSFTGTGARRILLIAHTDTVYPEGILAKQPWKVDGNRLYGPGIADDKGGIAVILHSLQLLKDAGWRDYAQLTVLFNPDEEVGSGGSGDTIAAVADQHEVVLSFEPTAAKSFAKQEGILLGAAGTATAFLEVKGKASHAGAAPELGRNALIELSHQLVQTRDVAKGVPGTQLNWTTAKAGEVRNQIPESASAIGDVRLLGGSAEKLQTALQDTIDRNRLVPDTQTTVKVVVGRPAYVAGESGRKLAAHAQAIYAEMDQRPLMLHPNTGGGTDAGFAGRSGKATVLESFGFAGFGYHARDEFIEIDSIVPRLYLVTRLLQDIGSGKAPGVNAR